MVYIRSVFVGQDRETNEIVALKRINTEQEENGFPITAIREVKILKALRHENIVNLKEIVTSKGEFFRAFALRGRISVSRVTPLFNEMACSSTCQNYLHGSITGHLIPD